MMKIHPRILLAFLGLSLFTLTLHGRSDISKNSNRLSVNKAAELRLDFSTEDEKFNKAVKEYEAIWTSDGEKIVSAMENIAGLKFKESRVNVIVYEGTSWSGSVGESPMKMRASYSPDVKKATLIHELGHRLIEDIPKTEEIDEHRVLFLILYDIWGSLYGKDFADKIVSVESKRKGRYDYEAAWKWTLAFGRDESAAKFLSLRKSADTKQLVLIKQEMDKIIHRSVHLPVSVTEAFRLFTEKKMLESWLTKAAEVEPRIGGRYELFWEPEDRENNSTLGCRITAFETDKLISFEWRSPKQFKDFANNSDPLTHVTVFFIPGKDVTEIHLIHSGWRSTVQWEEARVWQERAWAGAFQNLSHQLRRILNENTKGKNTFGSY